MSALWLRHWWLCRISECVRLGHGLWNNIECCISGLLESLQFFFTFIKGGGGLGASNRKLPSRLWHHCTLQSAMVGKGECIAW